MLGLFERAMETSPDVTDDCLASEDALNVSLSQASPLDHRESLLYYTSTTLQRRGRKPTDIVTSFRSDQDSLFGTSFGLQKCFLEKTRGFKEKLWVSGTCKGLDQGETFLSRQQNDRWISFKQASVSGYLLQLPTVPKRLGRSNSCKQASKQANNKEKSHMGRTGNDIFIFTNRGIYFF
ncbi:uncharacterized protein LOC128904178 isoform X2 [Rissa tridactyla]|uniref:uncharacterized protein LOC128904178 isoform X2 n=1 Tax=Rissa tridactyla TaxID=75485 RepID=UPI0023BA422C|nr:uncharacterized protein LOC128904178 isoform X2 [Rissa tridactyla]